MKKYRVSSGLISNEEIIYFDSMILEGVMVTDGYSFSVTTVYTNRAIGIFA